MASTHTLFFILLVIDQHVCTLLPLHAAILFFSVGWSTILLPWPLYPKDQRVSRAHYLNSHFGIIDYLKLQAHFIFWSLKKQVTCDGHRAATNSAGLLNFALACDVLSINTRCAKTPHLQKKR